MAVKGGDRFGADRTGNRTQGMTAAQRSNQSRSYWTRFCKSIL